MLSIKNAYLFLLSFWYLTLVFILTCLRALVVDAARRAQTLKGALQVAAVAAVAADPRVCTFVHVDALFARGTTSRVELVARLAHTPVAAD